LTDEVRQTLVFRGPGVVICVGNSLRGDDGAGPFIASNIPPVGCGQHHPLLRAGRDYGSLTVINAETTPENYTDEIISLNPTKVLFIDAADFGGEAGEVRVIPRESISDFTLSTHSFPLGAVCELIRQSIPVEVIFIGIQAKDCAFGEGISQEVLGAASEIIRALSFS
jgi:hydrogenase maturation protease HycI